MLENSTQGGATKMNSNRLQLIKGFFRKFTVVFLMFGICLEEVKPKYPRLMKWACVMVIVVILIVSIITIPFNYFKLSVSVHYFDGDLIARDISHLVFGLVSLITYGYFITKQQQFRHFLVDFFQLAHPFIRRREKLVRTMTVLFVVLPFLINMTSAYTTLRYTVGRSLPLATPPNSSTIRGTNTTVHSTTTTMTTTTPQNGSEVMVGFDIGYNSNNGWILPLRGVFLTELLSKIFWVSTLSFFNYLSCSLFLYICFIFALSFRDLPKLAVRESWIVLKTKDIYAPSINRSSRTKHFIDRHRNLCTMLKRADGLFSPMVFLWCSSEVVNFTFALRALRLTGPISNWRFTTLPYVISNLGSYLIKIMIAASVNGMVKTLLFFYSKLSLNFFN